MLKQRLSEEKPSHKKIVKLTDPPFTEPEGLSFEKQLISKAHRQREFRLIQLPF